MLGLRMGRGAARAPPAKQRPRAGRAEAKPPNAQRQTNSSRAGSGKPVGKPKSIGPAKRGPTVADMAGKVGKTGGRRK